MSKLKDTADKLLQDAKNPQTPRWKRLLKWLLALILAGAATYYTTSCTGIDSLILTGEQGNVIYNTNPDTGQKTITLTPKQNPTKITYTKK